MRLCVGLLLLACELCRADTVLPDSESMVVKASPELQSAVISGVPYVWVAAHLNLKLLAFKGPFLLPVSPAVRSIQGNCSVPPPAIAQSLTPLRPLSPLQCVLNSDGNLFGVNAARDDGVALWLSRLYLRVEFSERDTTLVHLHAYGPQTALYLEDVTVQGDPRLKSLASSTTFTVPFWLNDTTRTLLQRCEVVDVASFAVSGAIVAGDSSLAAEDSSFEGHSLSTSFPNRGVLFLEGSGQEALLVKQCTFNDVNNFAVTNNQDRGVAYTDLPQGLVYDRVTHKPLANAPQGTFADALDAVLAQIKQDVSEMAERLAAPFPPPPTHAAAPAGVVIAQTPAADGPRAREPCCSVGEGRNAVVVSVVVVAALALVVVAALAALVVRRTRLKAALKPAVSVSTTWGLPAIMEHEAATGTVSGRGARDSPSSGLVDTTLGSALSVGPAAAGSVQASAGSRPTSLAVGPPSRDSMTGSPRSRIEAMLELVSAGDGRLLGRFRIPDGGPAQRRRGGQAVVQFVEEAHTREVFAAKFFTRRGDFAREWELYKVEALRAAMPRLVLVDDVGWQPPGWEEGLRLPPCLVMEKGESLAEYVSQAGLNIWSTLHALGLVLQKLQALHAVGWVHRDLKPANLLWVPSARSWALLDFGCAATQGSEAPIAYTVAYAAPEVICADEAGLRSVVVQPAMDMWAFGVIAFEMLTEAPLFAPFSARADRLAAVAGRLPLPWEDEARQAPLMKKLGVFRKSVMQCLRRAPEERCSAAQLNRMWDSLFQETYQKDATQQGDAV